MPYVHLNVNGIEARIENSGREFYRLAEARHPFVVLIPGPEPARLSVPLVLKLA
jgi:hypothetical protein